MRIQVAAIFIILAIQACGMGEDPTPEKKVTDNQVSEALIRVNQYMVKKNHQHISNFVRRTGWDMKETDRGIWIEIFDPSNRKKIMDGDRIQIEYSLKLINGYEPYGKGDILEKSVVIGNTSIETGLDNALRMMSRGDSARIIVPPYLAYGNFGDSGKIPPDAILIYNVKVLDR